MSLTIADVERIAALAQLELTDDEKQVFARQLAGILDYATQVQAVDTTGVPATAHVLSPPERPGGAPQSQPADRADEVRPSLPVADVVSNAPDGDPDAGLFRVPRVIG